MLAFGNRVIDGTARLRAEGLGTQPCFIAACDPMAENGQGGVGDFIDQWGDPARLRLVDLDALGLANPPRPCLTASLPPSTSAQRIAGPLFADVVAARAFEAELLAELEGDAPVVFVDFSACPDISSDRTSA